MYAPENSSYKILIADDEPHIRQILRFTLERAGYQVFTASDGEEALARAADIKPSLVLLDVMMPKVDGYEVCRRMRQDFALNQVPVIMLSARGDQRDRVAGLEHGANDYLVKPYSNEELLLRVKNVLEWNIRQKEANPLTALPGNTAIEREMIARIARQTPYAFLYIDIDNFKGFNDYYGYPKGDEIIVYLADIIRRTVERLGGKDDFVGHIGGDDFVMVVSPGRAEIMAQYVVDEFDKGTINLLNPEDVKRGYLEVRDRQGELKRIPVMAVTIALVKSTDNQIEHFAEVTDIASSLKEYGKRIDGSVVVKERRQDTVNPARNHEIG
ncbi:MAG TPA: response regulator [Candidatus Krumholzibacteria bacterium]|nr:response regulator [Candidatus Krumholzibacteria bacterium]